MKHYILSIMVALLAFMAMAEDDGYLQLVREGVRWVNVREAFYDDYSCYFYNYEFRGDTVINGKSYKKCYRYTGSRLDLATDTAYCAMRDEGHKVYEVPFTLNEDFATAWWDIPDSGYAELLSTGEFTLFDFDNPQKPLNQSPQPQEAPAYGYVSGIGFNSENLGDSFHPGTDICTCTLYDTYGFHHLEDLDGNILYVGAAFDRVENVYSPLVREGIVWEYLYVNEDFTISIECFQVAGDTLIDIRDGQLPRLFRKCYRYYSDDRFDAENASLVAYLAEEARRVFVVTPPISEHEMDDFFSCFGDTYSQPDAWGYEKTGEREIYNFNSPEYFMQLLNETYQFDHFSSGSMNLVEVGEQMNRSWGITGIGMVNGKFVEGVGIDGLKTGNLIAPLRPSDEKGTQGLIRLADLDGKTLYRGAYFEHYSSDINPTKGDENTPTDLRWYDLMGRVMDGKPAQPGVYIHRGKKVVVR